MKSKGRKGIALVLVITVVLALTIVATPFVVSMVLQEQTATTARYASQAWYGAEGARNFATWRLMHGVDYMERRYPSGAHRTYLNDTNLELEANLDSQYLESISVSDPRGGIWGVTVQDEQGKINVTTAPERCYTRLLSRLSERLVEPKDYITQYSGRDMTWIYPQRIRGVGDRETRDGDMYVVGVDNAKHYGQGARLRVTKPGLEALEVTVTQNLLLSGLGNAVETNPQVPQSYTDGVVEVEERHRINPNTAKRETLAAVLEGLHLHGAPDDPIDGSTAMEVSRTFAGKRTERIHDFLNSLASLPLSRMQKVAVAINAIDPNFAYLEGTGTVGLCFLSHDAFTIEARASMNNPSGVEVAGRGFREVTSVSPPIPLVRHVESQHDFDVMMFLGIAQSNDFSYFPYGNRILSHPVMLPDRSNTALKPDQAVGSDEEAAIQPVAAKDRRGSCRYAKEIRAREHFDNRQEGLDLKGNSRGYRWDEVFTTNPSPATDPVRMTADIAAGGFEMWVYVDQVSNPMTLFDLREEDFANRLTLRAENGELIFTACDTSALGLWAEVRQPFTPEGETWYHFAAYWKSNKYGELAMLIDGFAHPEQVFEHRDEDGNKFMSKLAAEMTVDAEEIQLEDDSWLPKDGDVALQVGSEVVILNRGTGVVGRGRRNTNEQPHPQGAMVTFFGYVSKLRTASLNVTLGDFQITLPYDRLTKGGATVLYDFGPNPSARVSGDKQDPQTRRFFIDDSQSEINVETDNIYAFPDQGYITIDREVIFYTDRTIDGIGGRGNAKFTGCERGQHGTLAEQHNERARVRMWAVPVSDTTEYLSPTIIQLEDEWIGPVRRDPERPNYWISFVDNEAPLPLFRGILGGRRRDHASSEKVIPTFVAREGDMDVNRHNLGRGDRVTLTDVENERERRQVRRAVAPDSDSFVLNVDNAQIAAFYDNVKREYIPDELHARILKFPSGELIALSWLQDVNPEFKIGPLSAKIDELKFFAEPKERNRMALVASDTDTTLMVRESAGMPRNGGLLKIGEEYVGYGARERYEDSNSIHELSVVKRGWLNSTAAVHDLGDPVFVLSFIPVSALSQDVSETERSIMINQNLAGSYGRRTGRYQPGYVLIDEEVLLFEWQRRGELRMPPRWDGTTGLYRGMFGTQPAAHSADSSLVYGLPWRYWDTYKAQQFDNRMQYYQWSTRMEQALWRSITWTPEIPKDDPNIVLHGMVRVDGLGEFYDAPGVSRKIMLWDFIQPGPNGINRVGYLNDAGQFDVRFYVEYRPGSFNALQPWDAHSWKRTLKVKEIQIEYDRPTRVLYHEDR